MRIAAALLSISVTLLSAQDKIQARQAASDDALRLGVEAYKSAKYIEAARLFQKVVDLNPQALEARLYLGIAFVAQYIPGSQSPQNIELGNRAEAEFERVLAVDDTNETAIAWLANFKYLRAQTASEGPKKDAAFDEAAKWFQKQAEVNPDDAEAHYMLGVIAWNEWNPHDMETRVRLGMKPEDPGPLRDDGARRQMDAHYRRLIEDGIGQLRIAVAINPQHDNAMSYLNLLLRGHAELAATQESFDADIKEADQWGMKALETKKLKATATPAVPRP